MATSTRDVIKSISNIVKSRLNISYSLLRNEGFSSRFTSLLIILIIIGASAFGSLGLLSLIFFLSRVMGFGWEPLSNVSVELIGVFAGIFHAENIGDLMLHSFITLHFPIVIVIVIQKLVTRNLIKKYRDKESNLIKP